MASMSLNKLQKVIERNGLSPVESSYCIDAYFSQGYDAASRIARDFCHRRLKRRIRKFMMLTHRQQVHK